MTIEIKKLSDISSSQAVSIAAVADPTITKKTALYAAVNVVPSDKASAPAYQVSVALFPGGDLAKPKPQKISLPLLLPVNPCWSLALKGAGNGSIAYTQASGARNHLSVDTLTAGKRAAGYSYTAESADAPGFVINTSASAASQDYVSAVFESGRLGVLGLDSSSGTPTPTVTPIAGTDEAPVSAGRIWGDISAGIPDSLSLIYKTDRRSGPLAPGGRFCGALNFATFDKSTGKTGAPTALLDGVEFAEMDVAVAGDSVCLFATTGSGAPVLAQFDKTGKASGAPVQPLGSWNNPGRWARNPTIAGTPDVAGGFSFAFIEMDGETPVCIRTGTLSP